MNTVSQLIALIGIKALFSGALTLTLLWTNRLSLNCFILRLINYVSECSQIKMQCSREVHQVDKVG